jgi:hypothetical protein
MTHHNPDSGDATTILPIVFFVPLHRTCIRMALFPGTPKVESRNCPDFGLPGLWDIIASRPDLRSGRGLNQTYSPLRELFNAMSHSLSAGQERVDSRLLVVGSQTANLTCGPCFAHNLACRCPNEQCEAILDIYTSRPFQWHQKHPKARCFYPCCWTLKIRESWRTPNPQLWECEFACWNTFGARMSHRQTWTHKICHDLNLVEATTFPLVVYFAPLHEAHIQMAFGSHEILKIGIPATLRGHYFMCRPPIKMRSKGKLQPSSRDFQ